ncbi:uncharacterized protein KY384_005310 [Bacidia gigantensis]|uniref:uncharacterized protein n=1 Tax=Bacidia gigantensis TaxID=2732470 RepID=UPI001D057923|nr:uncharacterized protein KY384_005310 [Bacidia gigantensis]KAG8529829.1 hypothetical protein KY384_005310 [Bacidia gigantensis]
MPGRPEDRTSADSQVSKKSLTQQYTSRRATASPAINVPDEGPPNRLRSHVCTIFGDAQSTSAGHRKLVVGLRKLQEDCAYEPTLSKGTEKFAQHAEEDFNVEFTRCIIRLMIVKKGENIGDKLVRFICMFLKYANGALIPDAEQDDTMTVVETATSRLMMHVFSLLLQFLNSKEKTVRYRATQLVAHIINSMDSIDDEYYHLVKMGLLKRIYDKEAAVRVHAVMGLGRLAGNDDEDDQGQDSSDDDSSGLFEKLLEVLQNDPSAEVRRSLLLNLPLTPTTLPYLLERARDTDPATRRALYARLLPALGDFRHLSLSMREKLLRWGLRDRDENVRKATARLFRERWIEDCAGPVNQSPDGLCGQVNPPSADALSELLERIDIVNSGVEGGIASEAMKEFWEGRPDYREDLGFADSFWMSLTPESAFIARSWNDYHRDQDKGDHEDFIERKMPEVTKLAFFLQGSINELNDMLQRNSALSEGEEGEETIEQEFIVEQMLHIAKSLDYSDEIGRRKMFSLLRESLAIPELPDETTNLIVNVLRDICGNDAGGEREFCGVVLEAIAEVHDAIAMDGADNEEASFHSAQSELSDEISTKNPPGQSSEAEEVDEAKAIREIMINMKCLHIAQCMLENVEAALQSNMHLVTMLNNLVVPAVRSHEAPVREKGLICIGLCSLLDKNLAEENLTLFLHCFNKGHEALQVSAIHTLSDILETHPTLLTAQDINTDLPKAIAKMLSKAIKAQQSFDVQTAAITALCKLMLMSVITDEDLLKQAVILFFDPASKDNASMRQALSYSIPVYCYSRRENMERMARIAANVLHSILDLCEEIDECEDIISINMVGNLLVEWTDARKLVIYDDFAQGRDESSPKQNGVANGDTHLLLAVNLLERVLGHGCSKNDRKALVSMLGKLYITSSCAKERLQEATDLVNEAIDNKIAGDAASRTALNKLHGVLKKALGEGSNQQNIPADEIEQPAKLTDYLASDDDTNDHGLDEGPEGAKKANERDSVLEELLEDD